MKKSCKVITTYFGPRRDYPLGLYDTIDLWESLIESELNLDSGTETDILIINHDCSGQDIFGKCDANVYRKNEGIPTRTNTKPLNAGWKPEPVATETIYDPNKNSLKFLKELDGLKTKNGEIKFINRPWDEGRGGGFGSRNYIFEKYQDDYEYWFFTEDDINFYLDNYLSKCINVFEEGHNIGFLCTLYNGAICRTWKSCHGGIGLSSSKLLKEVVETYGHLPYSQITSNKIPPAIGKAHVIKNSHPSPAWYYALEQEGEVAFTNVFIQLGYSLRRMRENIHDKSKFRGIHQKWQKRTDSDIENLMSVHQDYDFLSPEGWEVIRDGELINLDLPRAQHRDLGRY